MASPLGPASAASELPRQRGWRSHGAGEGALRQERSQDGEEGRCLCPPHRPQPAPRAHMGAPRDHRGLLAGSHHLLWCFLGLCASFQEKLEEKKEKAGASWLGVRGLRGQTWGQSQAPHLRP